MIVKLVPATDEAKRREVGSTSVPVLQVTPNAVPVTAVSLSCTKIRLWAVTAVVLMTQVAPVAFVAQENCPVLAAAQATSDGLAADPTAAHGAVDENETGDTLEAGASAYMRPFLVGFAAVACNP